MDFEKITKIFDPKIIKGQTHFDYNPRLWHALNKLYRFNPKYKDLNPRQIILLNRYVHQKVVLNKKLFSRSFKIN